MTDKKKKLELTGLNETTLLTKEFKDEVFPNRIQGLCVFLEGYVRGEIKCYLCIDRIYSIGLLHIHIPEEHRSLENILELKGFFYSILHKWLAEKDFKVILVTCEVDDEKTTELFRTFDFKPKTMNVASMAINKEEHGNNS